jgi:hypothetical protein
MQYGFAQTLLIPQSMVSVMEHDNKPLDFGVPYFEQTQTMIQDLSAYP